MHAVREKTQPLTLVSSRHLEHHLGRLLNFPIEDDFFTGNKITLAGCTPLEGHSLSILNGKGTFFVYSQFSFQGK